MKHFNYENVNTVCLACTETFQNIHYLNKKNLLGEESRQNGLKIPKFTLLTKEEIDVT